MFDDRNLKPYAVNDEQIIPMNQTRINFDDSSIKGEAFLINDDKTNFYVTKQIILTIRVNHQEKKYSFKFANIRHMDEFTLQYTNGYLYFRSLMDFYVFDLSDENMSYSKYSLDQPTFNKYVVTFEWDNRLFLGSGQILYQYEPTGEVIEVLRLNEDESIVDGFHYQDHRILITYDSEVKKFSIDVYNEHFEKIKNLRNNLIIHPLHYEIGEDLCITSDGNLSQYSNQLTLLSSKYFFLEDLKQEWEYFPSSLHFLIPGTRNSILIQPWKDKYILTHVTHDYQSATLLIRDSYVVDHDLKVIYKTALTAYKKDGYLFGGGSLLVLDEKLILREYGETYVVTDLKEGNNLLSFPKIASSKNPFLFVSLYVLFGMPILFYNKRYNIF